MSGVRHFLVKRLKLIVNEAKSAVARPSERKFLGYSVTVHHARKIRIAKQSIERLKGRVGELCREGRGQTHDRSATAEILHATLAGISGGHPQASPVFCLNRRMRNRTYGDVRGLRG